MVHHLTGVQNTSAGEKYLSEVRSAEGASEMVHWCRTPMHSLTRTQHRCSVGRREARGGRGGAHLRVVCV